MFGFIFIVVAVIFVVCVLHSIDDKKQIRLCVVLSTRKKVVFIKTLKPKKFNFYGKNAKVGDNYQCMVKIFQNNLTKN